MKMIRFTSFMAIFALLAAMSVFAIESKPKNHDNTPTISMTGFATYYTVKSCQSEGTSGVLTANGESFDESALTCAMRRRDWGSQFKVTNLEPGKSYGKTCIVRLNDFGPGHGPTSKGVVIDLTPAGFKALGVAEGRGKVNVKVESYKPILADTPAVATVTPKSNIKEPIKDNYNNGGMIPIDPF